MNSSVVVTEQDFINLKIAGVIAKNTTWKTFKHTLAR